MIFGIKSKKSKQNNKKVDVSGEISQAYLDPNYLAEKLSSLLFEKTKHTSGHVHIHFRNKSDHIILVWSQGKLKRIIAKSPGCKKGEYKSWHDSEFSDYERDDVFRELYNEIECLEIEDNSLNETWASFSEFINWLIENSK